MQILHTAERFITLMEEDESRPVPLEEVEGLKKAIIAVRWAKHKAADREAAQALLMRLALLQHAAAVTSGTAPAGESPP